MLTKKTMNALEKKAFSVVPSGVAVLPHYDTIGDNTTM